MSGAEALGVAGRSAIREGGVLVPVIHSSSAVEILVHLHARLAQHFSALKEQRHTLSPPSPVFALEHDLDAADLELLTGAVREAIAQGLLARHRVSWLPFVVYAAESGYDYAGSEYWTSFESSTPGWNSDQRHWIKDWFTRFAAEYGGIHPRGAFAKTFSIIAWPISHAVLPVYLQRQLAQLLFEFRSGLSSVLLEDLDALGERLAVRARLYSDRFRIFCENTALLGRVAAALLSEDEEKSPYLTRPTLQRIVNGLSQERESREWLNTARHAASQVRTTGFRQSLRSDDGIKTTRRQSATDAKLFLKFLGGTWKAYAELPDLTSLSERLPLVYEELRTLSAVVSGSRRPVPHGALVYPGQEVRLESWPEPPAPFVQLKGGTSAVNTILTDQCVITRGPWWLFRVQGAGLAVEVKSRVLRPGHVYLLVGAESDPAPDVTWCHPEPLLVQGVRAYRLIVPGQLDEKDLAALKGLGLAALTTVAIRPVGVVASSWDGEGAAEWLAGETAMVGIRADLIPVRCVLMIDGEPHIVEWPAETPDLILALGGLDVGSHEVAATLFGADERELSRGLLEITVRDPQVRPENGATGEGLRMLASPARPTLVELWDRRANITVDSPAGLTAELVVRLRSSDDRDCARVVYPVTLPMDEDAWASAAGTIRENAHFRSAYDDAESCVVEVNREGLGMASLTFERGFRPLRWQFIKQGRGGMFFAKLYDQTENGTTTVTHYEVESPLIGVSRPSGELLEMPSRGGLLHAVSGESELTTIAPTIPNMVIRSGVARTRIPEYDKSIAGIVRYARAYRLWAEAETPGDPIAAYEQAQVLAAITSAIARLVGGSHWASIERRLSQGADPLDWLEEMKAALGVSQPHRALAAEIAHNFHNWTSPGSLVLGFDELIAPILNQSGMTHQPSASRFLLTLAGRPGEILDWTAADRNPLLGCVVSSPVLLRAARFAVLGTQAVNDLDSLGARF